MNTVEINRIFEFMLGFKDNISDLNFSVGRSPQIEVSGSLRIKKDCDVGMKL